jgi:hypothetical protein
MGNTMRMRLGNPSLISIYSLALLSVGAASALGGDVLRTRQYGWLFLVQC